MLNFFAGAYDIVVVGAGHAGIEAALAAARMGCRTLCVCTCLDAVGNMPCNPSIGGTAKGQLVREIDALGGEMARAADAVCLQFRMLNRGKGPAVYSPRAQADRLAYRAYMRRALERCPGLELAQGECAQVLTDEQGAVCGVQLVGGARYDCKAAVLATGTYLGAKTFTGEVVREIGPDGMYAATHLTACLRELGLSLRRFKTGTPARVSGRSLDFSKMEPQTGDPEETGKALREQYRHFWLVIVQRIAIFVTVIACVQGFFMLPMLSGVYESIRERVSPAVNSISWEELDGAADLHERILVGDDIVQLNRIEYGVREGERQAVLWVSSYDRIPGRKVYERLIETMSLQSERGETMYDYEDTGRYPGWYSSCRSSSGSLYVHYGQHTVPLEVGDTYVTFVYDRFGERIETRIELPEGGTQP